MTGHQGYFLAHALCGQKCRTYMRMRCYDLTTMSIWTPESRVNRDLIWKR